MVIDFFPDLIHYNSLLLDTVLIENFMSVAFGPNPGSMAFAIQKGWNKRTCTAAFKDMFQRSRFSIYSANFVQKEWQPALS